MSRTDARYRFELISPSAVLGLLPPAGLPLIIMPPAVCRPLPCVAPAGLRYFSVFHHCPPQPRSLSIAASRQPPLRSQQPRHPHQGSHAHRLEEGALGYSIRNQPQDAYFVLPPFSTGGPPQESLRLRHAPTSDYRGRRAAPQPRACSWPGVVPPPRPQAGLGADLLTLPA